MKSMKWLATLAATVAMIGSSHAAQDTVRYSARPQGSQVTIEGTSTLHDWTSDGKVIGGSIEFEAAFETDKSLKSVPSLTTKEKNPKASVIIPVRSLKCSSGEKMDEIMQEAMKASEHRNITYKLTEMVVKGDVPASGSPVKFDTKGDLSMSGKTQKVEMEIVMERMDDGQVKWSGEKALKMTDFGIEPPAPKILGMSPIKTGDDVTIKFQWMTAVRK